MEFIETKHRVAADYLEAVRQAVVAGLNIRTDFTMPDVYINAVRTPGQDGQAADRDRGRSGARRVAREVLGGLFDQPYVPDPKEADRIVRSAAHLEVARRAAHESIVLLKNDGALPLRKDLKSILVTGPNAAETRNSISRYGPSKIPVVSVLDGIRAKVGPSVRVMYTKGCEFVDATYPESEILPVPPTRAGAGRDRQGARARAGGGRGRRRPR